MRDYFKKTRLDRKASIDTFKYAAQDEQYMKQLKNEGIDNNNKHYGVKSTAIRRFLPQSIDFIKIRVTLDGTESSPKCECGVHKVYGPSCSTKIHSTWCPLYDNS